MPAHSEIMAVFPRLEGFWQAFSFYQVRSTMSNRGLRIVVVQLLVFCVYMFAANAQAHDEDDILVLRNGDRISGRLTKVNDSEVGLNSQVLGVLTISWKQIVQIRSRNRRWSIAGQGLEKQSPHSDFREAVLQSENNAIIARADVVSPANGMSASFLDQEHPAAGPQTPKLKSTPDSSFFVGLNAPESVVDGTQSQDTFGGTFRVLHNEPDLCKPASWFSALEATANHNRAYKVQSAAIVTDTYDGTVSLKNSVTSTGRVAGYGVVDLFGNSSLGIGMQQSYGGGISAVLFSNGCDGTNARLPKNYQLSVNGDVSIRYIHQRLYAPSGPLDLAGMRINEGLVYVPLFMAKDGSQKNRFEIDESIWATPMLNDARAIQAGGSVALSVPVGKSLSMALTEEDDFINNAPKAKRKNYVKSGVTITYTFPAPQTGK
jgi:hypothetical protein